MFQQSKLKGQKLNLATLKSKPEFKQQYLAPIRCLEEEEQCKLLKKVLNKDVELKVAGAEAKQMASLKQLLLG